MNGMNRLQGTWRTAIAALFGLILAGCSSGGSAPVVSVLNGVAAIGAPIAGGTVDVVCATGPTLQSRTGNDGSWQVTLATQTLPCKVRVTSVAAEVFHSLAMALGTVNITPLTDLIVANLAAGDPAAWFAQQTSADFQRLPNAAAVAAVAVQVADALGLTALRGINPLTATFAATASDPLDQALEALRSVFPDRTALLAAAQGSGLTDFLQQYGASLANAYAQAGTAGIPAALSAQVWNTVYANAQAGSPFGNGVTQTFVFSSSGALFYGPAIGSSTQVDGGTRDGSGAYVWSDTVNNRAFVVTLNADNTLAAVRVTALPAGSLVFGEFRPAAGSGGGSGGGASGGTASVRIDFSYALYGQSQTYTVTIANVVEPSGKAQFCDELVTAANSPVSLSTSSSTAGTFNVTGCDYAARTGTVAAALTSPVYAFTIPYTVTYTYF